MAYYPDGRQEQLFAAGGYAQWAELMHMMAYDQSGGHHSSLDFGRKVAKQGAETLPPAQVTLGLPFYGRSSDSVSPDPDPSLYHYCIIIHYLSLYSFPTETKSSGSERSKAQRLCWNGRGTG